MHGRLAPYLRIWPCNKYDILSARHHRKVWIRTTILLSVLWCAPLLFPLSYFPKCAPYKLPRPPSRHDHNYFQCTIHNQPTTAITVKSHLLRIKFFSSYIALQDFKLPLGRKPCGAELNSLLPGVPRSTSSYAITQVLLQKYRSFPTSAPNSPSQLTVLWSASLLSG